MNKKRIELVGQITVITLFGVLLLLGYISKLNRDPCEYYNDIKNQSIKGKIYKKKRGEIYIKNYDKILSYFDHNMYELTDVGDSIYKAKDSLICYIYSHDRIYWSILDFPDIKCDSLTYMKYKEKNDIFCILLDKFMRKELSLQKLKKLLEIKREDIPK